jgi:ABC-type bacteriocin/lantibiotic exporter with double-glycine peptidase domain
MVTTRRMKSVETLNEDDKSQDKSPDKSQNKSNSTATTEVPRPFYKNENIIEIINLKERALEYVFIFTFFMISMTLGETLLVELIYRDVIVTGMWYLFIIAGLVGSGGRFISVFKKIVWMNTKVK